MRETKTFHVSGNFDTLAEAYENVDNFEIPEGFTISFIQIEYWGPRAEGTKPWGVSISGDNAPPGELAELPKF